MQTFSVKNFEKFQHYKDRSPPWIKLYNELLDDYQFACLQDASKLHLILIWLLASRSDNVLPYDSEWVAKRINATAKVNLAELVSAGFLLMNQPLQKAEQSASKSLAKCLPRDRGEGETEERREEVEVERASAPTDTRSRKQSLPADFTLTEPLRAKAKVALQAAGKTVNMQGEFVRFCNHFWGPDARNRLKSDWDRAFVNWCLSEYAKACADPGESPTNGHEDPETVKWRVRLMNYKPGGYWPDIWGERPGEPGCIAPRALLRELGITTTPEPAP